MFTAAAVELAKRRECGNLSAVVRSSLYKEAGISTALQVNESAVAQIQAAEARTVKYSVLAIRMIPFRQSTSSSRSFTTSEHRSPRSVTHLTIAYARRREGR